ncbi:hypothetical protein K4K57_011753 [Colletotrichum sp. SAR 10_99]|nr:hypothetical protein K4K57_011753 [Colletotrichum sp. SAR 10_99]
MQVTQPALHAVRVLDNLQDAVKQVGHRPRAVRDLLVELQALTQVIRQLHDDPGIDTKTGDLNTHLVEYAKTLLDITQSLIDFAVIASGLLSSFNFWHYFRYKMLSIADCVYVVAAFKTSLQLDLRTANPQSAALAELGNDRETSSEAEDIAYLNLMLGSLNDHI